MLRYPALGFRLVDEPLLAEQKRYYAARAPEYEDWWFRRGRYDFGAEAKARWFAEVAELEAALDRFDAAGDVLELACGTGVWTRRLAGSAARLTALDAAAEMIELNRRRVGGAGVEYVQADVFSWTPARRHDVCFFGFWLSHVPESRFAEFWERVAAALRPDGRVFLVDSGSGERAHTRPGPAPGTEIRRLGDGREFAIVKRAWEPRVLERQLAALGWAFDLSLSSRGSFLYGSGSRAPG
jgi:SAM-dependent methyltransferase